VINVIGHSCSGKTTYIAQLIGRLGGIGKVATIKHLGHHQFTLTPGKDTTVFYERGAVVSAGIDSEKSFLIFRNTDLAGLLDIFADLGYDYTVIEGFKSMGLPAIVMGELEAGWILFRNPTIEQVVQEIACFPEYHTVSSLERAIERDRGQKNTHVAAGLLPVPSGGVQGQDITAHPAHNNEDSSDSSPVVKVSCTAVIKTAPGADPLQYENLNLIAERVSAESAVSFDDMRIVIAFRNWPVFSGPQEVFIVAIARGKDIALSAIMQALDILKRKLAELDIEVMC
jgi:molybdopterin-guanine dinucleotide biosynthesis protein MobB